MFQQTGSRPRFANRLTTSQLRSRHWQSGTVAVVLAGLMVVMAVASGAAAETITPGAAVVPDDAAFLSATLRGREQYDRFINSNAFSALRDLPAVQKALDEFATQQTQPGNPLAMAAMFMQMPENKEAAELLQDMVATNTFVYGTPSWVTVAKLLKEVQQAQQAGNFAMLTNGMGPDAQQATTGMIVKMLAENTDQIVIPDLVWGFQTTQHEAADRQLQRIEMLLKMFTQSQPMLANAIKRQSIGKGDYVTFRMAADPTLLRVGLSDLADELDLEAEVNAIVARVSELEFVIALGRVDDYVILSIGGGSKHLEKLSSSDNLLASEAFELVRKAQGEQLTGISYLSEDMVKVTSQSADDFKQVTGLIAPLVAAGKLPEAAQSDLEDLLESAADGYASRLLIPGAYLACSQLTDSGYAGEVWNWSQNLPWNSSQPLNLLEHVGGSPLAALAFRTETDPEAFEAAVAWLASLYELADKHLAGEADEDAQEGFKAFQEHILPLGSELAETIRSKFLPALANGQFGLVLDAKTTTTKIQKRLPASADPLPLIEPAIVLALDDATLFREGLSDLFALSDKLLAAIREIDENAVPSGYQIPSPEQQDVTGGKLWNFALPDSGLDEQIQMSIGVGEKVAVFSLVPQQAARLLTGEPLETAGSLTAFDKPLAAAAALDWVGLIDAIEPWVIFGARCGVVQNKGERLDPESTIDSDVETDETKKDLAQIATILDVLRCLKAAAAETSVDGEVTVTRWQNKIEDLSAE